MSSKSYPQKQNLPKSWRKVKLGDLNLDISDGNYSSKYPKKEDFVRKGVPFIRADNFKDGKITWEDMRFISLGKHQELQKGHLKQDDVLITTRGEIGRVAYISNDFIDVNINAQIVRLNTKNIIDSRFFFYYLLNRSSQGYFQSIQTGTALQQLPVGMLKSMEICFPENQKEQKRIADILSAFDEKIEVNNKINKTLEEMAAAIFKEWFGDSEKLKVKSEKLGNLVDIEYGRGPSSSQLKKTGYPVYGANGIIGYFDSFKFLDRQIIVGCRGVVGNITLTLPQCTITHNSLVITPRNGRKVFFYYLLRSQNLDAVVGGSAQPQITIRDLQQLDLLLPNEKSQDRFEVVVGNIEKKRLMFFYENQTLAALRDLLLTKLMSGEVKV